MSASRVVLDPVRSIRLVVLAVAMAVTVLIGLVPAASPAQAAPPLPNYLERKGAAQQLITVTAKDWKTSYGTLQLWDKKPTGWVLTASYPARLGYTGFQWANKRKQSDGSTPAGAFTMTQTFGNGANPGTKMPYRKVSKSDYWVYDPKCRSSYNTWQKIKSNRCWRKSWAEHLSAYTKQYRLAAIINFNRPNNGVLANRTRGGGIFLHVNGKGATAGCVSLTKAHMWRVMKWLDPAKKPMIIMAPTTAIKRL